MVVPLGPEGERVDRYLDALQIPRDVRQGIWESAKGILSHGPTASGGAPKATGIAIGYVQSGKTTSFTSLIALAADAGYRVVVAMLGSTTLLLEQNRQRLLDALDLERRKDYRWLHYDNPSLKDLSPPELAHYLSLGRIVLITLLKHYGRIEDLAAVLTTDAVGQLPVLVVDDEADQTSLNTRVRQGEESSTYRAVGLLRKELGPHLYVQYTATPYAPLLLQVEDFLSPDFVELLKPGPGYVGGRELLVDNRPVVVREISDAPGPAEEPTRLPPSLKLALADFIVGAARLLARNRDNAPVSMLIHPTGRRDPQRRYEFLVEKCLAGWRIDAARDPLLFRDVEAAFVDEGGGAVSATDYQDSLRLVLNEAKVWRINSDEDAQRTVRWNISPVHVLIGGNKLDRGFTVEGLTVSWLGRPPSNQLDTMVQRARAYGYRGGYIAFCRIYGSARTLDALSSGVDTELDMRARIREMIEEGRPLRSWASDVGVVLGTGLQPTRSQVVMKLVEFRPGWHLLSRPEATASATEHNMQLVRSLGLEQAPKQLFGRIYHPTMEIDPVSATRSFLDDWILDHSPGWDRRGIKAWLNRLRHRGETLQVVLLAGEDGKPRVRSWDPILGFDQLMQGRDPVARTNAYPGDRALLPGRPQIQVHVVRPRGGPGDALLALAVNAVDPQRIVRREAANERGTGV